MLRTLKRAVKHMPLLAIPGVFFGRVLPGLRAYRSILRQCPPEQGWRVYFMDYAGSGDTYLSCAYLRHRGRIGARDAFAAAGGLSLKIARLFGFGRYMEIRPRSALTVRMMERFYGRRLELLPLLYESDFLEYSGVFRYMGGHRGLDFMSLLKIGLEANCGLSYEEGPWEQPQFPCDGTELDELFRRHALIPGRTVLLAPYAGKHSLWGISMDFYQQLARQLQAEGLTVCTNTCSSSLEPPVPGTVPILVPHRLARRFCEQAGCFIGLRSGLCDIVSAAQGCKKVVLSGDMTIPALCASHQAFFSLENMGLCRDALELGYDAATGRPDMEISGIVRWIKGEKV